MMVRVKAFQETPNPNAVKCVLEGRLAHAPRSYFNAAEAQGDGLAKRLFAIPGVTNVLLQPGWITVSKAPAAEWKAIRPAIEQAVREG
jgi:hypothetical protein